MDTIKEKNSTTYTNSLENMKKYYYNKGFRNGILIGISILTALYFFIY